MDEPRIVQFTLLSNQLLYFDGGDILFDESNESARRDFGYDMHQRGFGPLLFRDDDHTRGVGVQKRSSAN